MPTTDCVPQLRLDFHPDRPVDVAFDGPELSSDGGVLLIRQVDDQVGLCAMIAAAIQDPRDPDRVVHSRLEQIRQRVFQIALGYEDCNDATTLRHDPLLKTVCDRAPHDEQGLSSQPTLSRLEHAATARDLCVLQRALEQAYVEDLPADTTVVVLDVDTTDDPTHGQQPLAFFHRYYDHSVYYPVLLFDGDGRLVSLRLRPGNAGQYRYTAPLLERVIRAIKARFPTVQIVVRGDAGFGVPRLLDLLESLDQELGEIDYVLGIQSNAALLRHAYTAMARAQAWFQQAHAPTRCFDTFEYAAKSWPRPRQIVVKAEHLEKGPNPRFIVTSLKGFPPRLLYERGYCGRGQAELYIKDFKNALQADRLSCTTYVANAFRLLLHAAAYRLFFALRTHVASVVPRLAHAQFDTLRLRLLKVAACVRQSVRRITVTLPRAFRLASVFRALAERLRLPVPAS